MPGLAEHGGPSGRGCGDSEPRGAGGPWAARGKVFTFSYVSNQPRWLGFLLVSPMGPQAPGALLARHCVPSGMGTGLSICYGSWEQVAGSRLRLVLGVGSMSAPQLVPAPVGLGGCSEPPVSIAEGCSPRPRPEGPPLVAVAQTPAMRVFRTWGCVHPAPGSATGVPPTAGVSAKGRWSWCKGDRRGGQQEGLDGGLDRGRPSRRGRRGRGRFLRPRGSLGVPVPRALSSDPAWRCPVCLR